MVYRKISAEERLADPDDVRRKRQRREGMARGRKRDPAKYNRKALDYYYANQEVIRAKRKEWAKANPTRSLLANAKNRAKKKNLEFNIELADIIIPEFCPITNLKLETGPGKIHYASPTLDRIDNSKGYIKGNVAVISNKANKHKGELSIEEIKQLYLYVKENTIGN